MTKYLIYSLHTGLLKSVITTSGDPSLDTPSGYGYIQYDGPTEGVKVDVESKALIPVSSDLPHVLSTEGRQKKFRNRLLSDSDWTQSIDSPLEEGKKKEWALYRQALRDLPQQNPDVFKSSNIVWPDEPSSI